MKTKEEVWVQFACTALSTLLAERQFTGAMVQKESAALADRMTLEWDHRRYLFAEKGAQQ